MKKLAILVLLLAFPMIANATPSFVDNQDNEIYFQAKENWVDVDSDNKISVNDYFYGIINSQNIDSAGSTIWSSNNASNIDSFSGYFLQEVKSVAYTGTDTYYLDHIDSATGSPVFGSFGIYTLTLGAKDNDPFNILNTGEIMRLFTDDSTGYTTAGTVTEDIANATDGTLWGSFGVTNPNAYWYATAVIEPDAAFEKVNTIGDTFGGLFFDINNTGYDILNSVNDPSENIYNTDVDMYTNAEIVDYGPNTTSPWRFQVNDPAVINPVPEPSTLLLLGGGLLGLGFLSRRKKKA